MSDLKKIKNNFDRKIYTWPGANLVEVAVTNKGQILKLKIVTPAEDHQC